MYCLNPKNFSLNQFKIELLEKVNFQIIKKMKEVNFRESIELMFVAMFIVALLFVVYLKAKIIIGV